MSEFHAESWPLEAAASSLAQVIDGFAQGDTRPLVIGDGDQPVLVVLSIADLADFRSRLTHLLDNPVDAGWLRYYLRSNFDMSSESLVELLGVDTDHGLTSLLSQVSVEQAAVLLPDHLRRAEEGANPLMLIGDGRLASAALVSFKAFAVLLEMEGGEKAAEDPDSCAHDLEEKPTTPLETLAERLGPVSTQIVAQLNAGRDGSEVLFGLHFEDELVEHLRDLESRAQAAPGGGAYDELRDLLKSLDEMRSGNADVGDEAEAPYVEAADLPAALPQLRDHFRDGEDDPYIIGIDGKPLAGLITYDVYQLLQDISVNMNGTDDAPVLPLPAPAWEDGPPVQPFEMALRISTAVVDDIAGGEGSILFIADQDGDPELVIAPLVWLWAYVDYLDLESVEA
ncbi:hypothetical protein OG394_13215 [Kribbella sp. NBC_01245]|uniref:hypothetical protein n=1 Tax=Kribbella sp. NBC_01245 TaxID=2903578 RepID=UPI002E2D892E|nr:hypothetical protein [Kribbella sp. NBC_01245]